MSLEDRPADVEVAYGLDDAGILGEPVQPLRLDPASSNGTPTTGSGAMKSKPARAAAAAARKKRVIVDDSEEDELDE